MKKKSYQIDKATNRDITEMINFWRATEGIGVGVGDDEPSLQLFLRRNPTTSLIMKDEGRLIGTVLGGFDGRRGFIYHLAIDPAYRRRGLGKELLDKALTELVKVGAPRTHLFVWNDNVTAIEFYKSLGWLDRHDVEVFTWIDKSLEATGECAADTCRC